MQKVIWITTTRFSEFFRRLLHQYREDVRVEIDGARYGDADLDSLIASWCTNAKIEDTRNFRLWRGEAELFGFHDSPRDGIWAAQSELPFVQALAQEHIVRYRMTHVEESHVWSWIKSLFRVIR